jgi:uncharacterized protein YjdB
MPALQPRRASQMTRLILIAAPVLFAAAFVACGGEGTTAPGPTLSSGSGPNGKNAKVRVTPSIDTLNALGATLQLSANVPAATWTSLTPGVASVGTTGQVTAVAAGTARIEAAAGSKADTATVLVRQILAFVQVTPDSILLPNIGDVGTLTAVAQDSNGYAIPNAVFTWASDATAVATVADGVVTGVGTGTTMVRATDDGLSDSARVVVDVAAPYP